MKNSQESDETKDENQHTAKIGDTTSGEDATAPVESIHILLRLVQFVVVFDNVV
jgi:hypothetical protein